MKQQAVIRRRGNLAELSRDCKHPLAMHEYRPLLKQLRYRLVTHLYGDDVIVDEDPITSKKTVTRVVAETRRCYRFDDRGRLACGAGYIDRIYAHYHAAGYEVAFIDITPDAGRALEPSWGKLARHPEFTPTLQDRADFDQLESMLLEGRADGPPPVDLSRRVKQDEIIRVVARRVAKRLGGIVQAPPGLGKSIMLAAYPLLYRRAKVAIVVPGRDNVFKTHRHLTRFLPDVGIQGCGKKARPGQRVVVYTPESAGHIADDTHLIFFDEVHKAATPTCAAALARVAPDALRFGFSATPTGRADGTDARLEGMFGPVVYTMTWPEAVALGLILSIEVRWLSCNFAANPADGIAPGSYRRRQLGIWRHEARNALFAAAARRHEADQVLIMVDKIEHALHMARLLPEYSLVYGRQDLEYFDKFRKLVDDDFEPVSPARREEMRLAFERGELRKVIATDVWATGVSFDALQVLFRADARSSSILDEQIPGRTCRVHDASGKRVGILYDCDDEFDRGFRAAAARRRANYRSKGWAQTSIGRAASGLAQ